MCFWKKTVKEPKPVVVKFPVNLYIHMTSSNYEPNNYTLNIPEDGLWEYESIGGKIKIFDKDKNVVRIFNPQAGYSVDIDIIYNSKIIYK